MINMKLLLYVCHKFVIYGAVCLEVKTNIAKYRSNFQFAVWTKKLIKKCLTLITVACIP